MSPRPSVMTQKLLKLIECNLDDTNPEFFPYIMEKLFQQGARDVWLTPIIMKQGRPAQCLSVLCAAEDLEALCEQVLQETTTLGLRVSEVIRWELERTHVEVDTGIGIVRVKLGYRDGRLLNAAPEFADCRRLAEESGVPLKEVYQRALQALQSSETTGD